MSVWLEELRVLGTEESNRTPEWCADELAQAVRRLLEDYRGFLAKLIAMRRRNGHRWHFACCAAARPKPGRPSRSISA